MTFLCQCAPHFHFRTNRSCSKSSLGGLLLEISYADWYVQRCKILSHVWKLQLKTLSSTKISALICVKNCKLSYFSHAVIVWNTCNLYNFRCRLLQRILWTLCCMCNFALPQEMNYVGLHMKACQTWSTSSFSHLRCSGEFLFPHCQSV
jgi:hypothetical protein